MLVRQDAFTTPMNLVHRVPITLERSMWHRTILSPYLKLFQRRYLRQVFLYSHRLRKYLRLHHRHSILGWQNLVLVALRAALRIRGTNTMRMATMTTTVLIQMMMITYRITMTILETQKAQLTNNKFGENIGWLGGDGDLWSDVRLGDSDSATKE